MMKSKLPKFRQVSIPWNKPVTKQEIPKQTSLVGQEPRENCVYETVWTSVTPAMVNENTLEEPEDKRLIVSRVAIDITLPSNWHYAVINEEDALLSVLSSKHWSTVLVIGSGSEDDVVLALSLLQCVIDNTAIHVEQIAFITGPSSDADAGLWGLARTFRLERPDIRLCCIESPLDKLVEAVSLTFNYPGEDEFSIDKEDGFRVPRLRRCNIHSTESISVRSDATYIISGGLGELGLVVANFLVERGAKHLLLFSRTPRTPENMPQVVFELRQRAKVECLPCDVSKEKNVFEIKEWLLQNDWPAVRGIVHAAGVLTDGTIPKQSAEKLRQAFAAKVHGARNLRSTFKPSDFFILFSSAAATFGLAGQSSYAAANATLDAMALKWVQAGENVLSIQWGAWSEVGMAVRNDAAKHALSAGFGAISNTLGLNIFEKLLVTRKVGLVCVSPIDWTRLVLDMPLLSTLRKQGNTLGSQRNISDPLLIVRQAVAEVIGRDIADNTPLMESGLDSLGSVSLRNRIASQLGVDLPINFVLEAPDVRSMVKYLSTLVPRSISKTDQDTLPISNLPVLVIGAGIGGLSFARQLEKANVPIVVMDSADHIGGVWHSLANVDSKLQIDSPAYDFDSTLMPSPNDHRWNTTFPKQAEILAGAEKVSSELIGPVYLKTRVINVRKVSETEYEVIYQKEGREQKMRVSGVAAMIGGLHQPRLVSFSGEEEFKGPIGLGISNDMSVDTYKDASVVIIGHGAFAVENMRTALENGAKHVTILCRQRNLVFSTFCTWLLNTGKGTMSVNDLIDVVRPFYSACGINVEELPSLTRSEAGELTLDQATLPPGSDIYFLAQMLGKLRVVVGEVDHFSKNSVVTKNGDEFNADVILKCLGSHRDESILTNIFGKESKIQGIWINDDPNLFTYNDGAQVPRNMKSLVCGSYAFFVQAFVPAYLHFRQQRDSFERALSHIYSDTAATTNTERVIFELWNFVEPAKRVVAQRTLELCPFDRFQLEREAEWERYIQILGANNEQKNSLWELLHSALSIIHRRNPRAPVETRKQKPSLGKLSVFVPQHRKLVLFLPGQGTNARLARNLLERTGWIGYSEFDFVVPDAPYEMPAFTNEWQLEQLGLDSLVSVGLYDKNSRYREWRAGFDALFDNFNEGKPIQVTNQDIEQWNESLIYLSEIIKNFGPFDGIAGFCEGAAVASVALHLQANGKFEGLDSVQFFIAMSPWRSPMHQQMGLFQSEHPLQLPMLQTVGENDMDVFLAAAPHFRSDFAEASEFRHSGTHVYPTLTPGLENKLHELLSRTKEGSGKVNIIEWLNTKNPLIEDAIAV